MKNTQNVDKTIKKPAKNQVVNQVLGTPGAEMPDPHARSNFKSKEVLSAVFQSQIEPERIPESQGDLVDQAQSQIDIDLNEKINNIRRKAK